MDNDRSGIATIRRPEELDKQYRRRATRRAVALAAAVALTASCETPGVPKPEPEEDEPGWSCERHGNRDCGDEGRQA